MIERSHVKQIRGRGRENFLPMVDVKLRYFIPNMHIQPGNIKFVSDIVQIGGSMSNITCLKPRSTSAQELPNNGFSC
jgi:hypothetical protein